MKKTILHHTNMRSTKYGGLEHFIIKLNKQLADEDCKIIIQYESEPASKIFCQSLAEADTELIVWPTLLSPVHSFFSSLNLYRRARPTHIITHFLSSPQYFACLVYSWFNTDVRLVSIFHLTPRMSRFSLATFCLQKFDSIIPVSRAVERNLLQAGLDPFKINQHYIGIFTTAEQLLGYQSNRDSLRSEMGFKTDQIVIGCILFNHPVKGPDILLEAFATALQTNPELRLLLVGIEPGKESNQLLSKYNVPQSTIILPGIITDEAIAYLAAADIYVQPSRDEALGLALIEAAAIGLPLVGANTGGIPEVIIEGKTGELFKPEDSLQLTNILLKLSANLSRRQNYAEGATSHYNRYFNGHINISDTAAAISDWKSDLAPDTVGLTLHLPKTKAPKIIWEIFKALENKGFKLYVAPPDPHIEHRDGANQQSQWRNTISKLIWPKLRTAETPFEIADNSGGTDTFHLNLGKPTPELAAQMFNIRINGEPILLAPVAILDLLATAPALVTIEIYRGNTRPITATIPLVAESASQSLDKLAMALADLLESTLKGELRTAPIECLPALRYQTEIPRHQLLILGIRILRRRIESSFRARKCREHWWIATTTVEALDNIEQLRTARWDPLEQPKSDNYLADPFLFTDYGRHWLLAEEFDHKRQKGFLIGYDITDCHQPKKMTQPLLELETHLSYPFTFTHEDKRYLMPENGSSGSLALYPLTAADNQLITGDPILLGIAEAVYDATLFKHNSRYWIVGSTATIDTNTHLSFWYAPTPFGPWSAHDYTPVAIDVRFGRPAGSPFHYGEHLHLPLQNGALKYGDQINIVRIDELTPSTIRLTRVTSITKNDISIAGKTIEGIHTINFNGATVAIDYFSYLPA